MRFHKARIRSSAGGLAIALAAACSSTSNEPVPAPAAAVALSNAVTDLRLAELQVTLGELLDRMEVINDRLQRLEAGAPASVRTAEPATGPVAARQASSPGKVAPLLPPGSQSSAIVGAMLADRYRNALTLYGKGRIDDARRAFTEVFEADVNGDLADNALYWIGETYLSTGKYGEAMKYFRRVETEYPQQNKAPDALLKVGLTYEKLGDLGLARKAFESLIANYPYAPSAATARKELERIKY